MNGFLDHFLVGMVLLAGFGYATYSLGPKSLRGRILLGIVAAMQRLPGFPGLRGVALRLTAAAKTKGACGGCDNCGSGSPSTAAPQAPAPEVRIPVSTIGKRPPA